MLRPLAAAAIVVAFAATEARASWFIVNESDNTIEVAILQVYGGKNDEKIHFRQSFQLKPGADREIGAKWMETNTFWLVVRNNKTKEIYQTKGDWRDKEGELMARVKLETCWMRTDNTYAIENKIVARKMLDGNWEALKELVGENKLIKLPAMRITPAFPHNRDPGFSVKVTNKEVTYRRHW